MGNKQVWVSPDTNGGWRIHKPGDKRDIVHLNDKSEAIEQARKIAKHQENELIIQKRDGRIQSKDSYGRDPFPPRDGK